ncbi:MAG: gamma-glutamyltransferase [Caldilineales bacterium]
MTAAAGAQMLQEGGNAVDAAVAAAFVSAVSEYTLSAIGGSGFALVYDTLGGTGDLYDFFSAAPGLDGPPVASVDDIDFRQITVDYGVSRQHFYVGRGAVAVPGNVAGLCAMAGQSGRLPLPVLLEPAIRLMREGCPVSGMQHAISTLIEPIFLMTAGSRAIFCREDGGLLRPGDLLRMPELADTLELLGREGPELFYRGDVARAILADQRDRGGVLTAADLAAYEVVRRRPLASSFRAYTVVTNPPPSRGGLLINFALQLLDGLAYAPTAQDIASARHVEVIAEIMRVTTFARRQMEQSHVPPEAQETWLLSKQSVARWTEELHRLLAMPASQRPLDLPIAAAASTTQISVMDEDGLLVSLTTTAGEGTGFVVPGVGIILNNMMGEADLHPLGWFRMTSGQRIPSMMAPTVVLRDGRPVLTLGSGGANRIRSAIMQVLVNTLSAGMPLDAAVYASRVHFEDGVLQIEGGHDAALAPALDAAGYTVNAWPDQHMYFGGVHAVAERTDGQFAAVGDPRRGGSAIVVGATAD